MAEERHKAIKIKSPNIKQVFNTMEYGKISENTNLSKAWLEKEKKIISAYTDAKKNVSKGKTVEVQDLNNGESLATVYSPKPDDVNKIIQSMYNKSWLDLQATERGILMDRLAREIERNSTLICQLEVSARGILSTDTKTKALPLLIEYLSYYASWAVKYKKENEDWETEGGLTVSIIADDSFLAVFGFVLGPALAAGYNIIFQTEPRISLVATLIVELAENVGIPEGVIKLMPGHVNPNSIFTCMDVGVISRFGNLHSDKYNNITKALNKKFLAITNSKAPMIVFNNGDLDSACESVIDAAWGYQGLLPWSLNTILVQEDIFTKFVDKLKYRLSNIKMGPATDKMADVSYPTTISYPSGAMEQLQKVLNEAKLQGIEVYQSISKGETLQPTLLIGGNLFGNNVLTADKNIPAVTVLAFRTSNEAVSLANNNRYGLGASVWTENISLANEVVQKLNVANVWINCHGNFTAAVPMTPQKQSGIGYFGGAEGFLEYINADMFYPGEFKENIVLTNLPNKAKDNPLLSFYAGSFKKSESGLVNGIYDHPVGKDLQNAMAAAKKGQESWNKMTSLMRSQLLRKVADEMNSQKKSLSENSSGQEVSDWISAIYEGIAQTDNLGCVLVQKSYELRSLREAAGVIAVDGGLGFNNVILGALLLGNSVIILNSSPNYSLFGVKICKIFQACGIPAGVLNIILNCNQDIFSAFMTHKELNVYFSLTYDKFLNKINVRDLKRVCPKATTWSEILVRTTRVKNIWSTAGDSVL